MMELNAQQRKAVRSIDGPLLVLAGAGSGKTSVLTHRIAYLIGALGVPPARILAMTFTNKAADEMRKRVESLMNRSSPGMWIGTFHSICARMLRIEAPFSGFKPNFAIYDADDQLALLRNVIRGQELSDKQYPPKQIRARISQEKNRMVDPDLFAERAATFYEQQIARIYRQYQTTLRAHNAVDFDDLLITSVTLLRDNLDVLARYQERFRYCMIDEYQDTNRPQYLLTNLLSEKHRNICVVGDDDQSIYAWRGADIRNILEFEKDYPDAEVIRLEQNYRSTQIILDAGNAVIGHNMGRMGKQLWTDRPGGEKIRVRRCLDEAEEAEWISGTLADLKANGGYGYKEIAVLYRTNAQSRALEEALRHERIPYVIVGGVRFYERKEVKDTMAYLRLTANPFDGVSLMRVINTPRRGIGAVSFARLEHFAGREGIALYEALGRVAEIDGLSDRIRKKMTSFRRMIEDLREEMKLLPADQLAAQALRRTGYWESLAELSSVEAESKTQNLRELLGAVETFVERSDDPSLEAYLGEAALLADVDQWSDASDAVTLMTLHSAKGLEFPVVVVSGLEEGLLPIIKDDETALDDVEEERRLFYVGITRAKERLFLTHTFERRRYGGLRARVASRFVKEIPGHLLSSFDTPPDSARTDEVSRPLDVQAGSCAYDVGAWVVHPTFGPGQIESRTGQGEAAKLTIRFQSGVKKKVIAGFARLKQARIPP